MFAPPHSRTRLGRSTTGLRTQPCGAPRLNHRVVGGSLTSYRTGFQIPLWCQKKTNTHNFTNFITSYTNKLNKAPLNNRKKKKNKSPQNWALLLGQCNLKIVQGGCMCVQCSSPFNSCLLCLYIIGKYYYPGRWGVFLCVLSALRMRFRSYWIVQVDSASSDTVIFDEISSHSQFKTSKCITQKNKSSLSTWRSSRKTKKISEKISSISRYILYGTDIRAWEIWPQFVHDILINLCCNTVPLATVLCQRARPYQHGCFQVHFEQNKSK